MGSGSGLGAASHASTPRPPGRSSNAIDSPIDERSKATTPSLQLARVAFGLRAARSLVALVTVRSGFCQAFGRVQDLAHPLKAAVICVLARKLKTLQSRLAWELKTRRANPATSNVDLNRGRLEHTSRRDPGCRYRATEQSSATS